jgi:periplasmic protein TonB
MGAGGYVLIALVLMATAGIAQGAPPRVQPPDCAALMAAPAPGVVLLCDGEAAMRRAATASEGSAERVQHWRAAADGYARAVNQLQALEHRIYALERLVDLNGPAGLRNPEAVEQALRGLVQMEPQRVERALTLAKLQEAHERFDAAEETLLFARQAHQDSLDLTRELSKFYARRVLALTPKDDEGKPVIGPPPEPAWKPDCGQTTFAAPGPGIGDICLAEAEMRRALGRGRTPEEMKAFLALDRKTRLAHMENAARHFRAALPALRESAHKVHVYQSLARLYGSANLGDPQRAESAVRDWIALEPGRVEPIIQLAAVQEDMKQPHVAEQTLVGTRQLYPDEIEVMKALSRFFARQASAASMIASRAETDKEPAPTPNQPDAEGNYRVGSQIKAPKKVEDARSEYPEEARAVGLEGTVIMEIWVDETGQVVRARMLRGMPMLEESAVAAVMQWRFAPTVVDGKPVPVRMTVTHGFTIR